MGWACEWTAIVGSLLYSSSLQSSSLRRVKSHHFNARPSESKLYRYDTGIWPFLIVFGVVWYFEKVVWYLKCLILFDWSFDFMPGPCTLCDLCAARSLEVALYVLHADILQVLNS